MKAIILTYAPVKETEKELLKKTKIYKLALNQHAKELVPDARIVTDYILDKIYNNFSEKIISLRDRLRYKSDRVEYCDIEFKGSTILAAIDYLISKKYDEILIVGDNKVNHSQFRNEVNEEIDKIINKAKIYQYTRGNFNLPVVKISDFCSTVV